MRREEVVGGEDVGAGGVAAEGEDGRVLEEEERVADFAGLARGDDALLDGEAFGVGDAAELEEMDVHAGLQRLVPGWLQTFAVPWRSFYDAET